MDISQKTVVITGGAKGLGKEMARIFKERGANVVVLDKDEVEMKKISEELGVDAFLVDVTKEETLKEATEKIISKYGRIDIWINNAGVWMPPEDIESIDMRKAGNLFHVNVFGTICGMRTAIRQMKIQKGGMVVNVISTTAFDGMNGSSGSMYVASKYALRGLTNVLREELKPSNIEVTGVYPGGMKTELFGDTKPNNLDHFMKAEDIAKKIVENIESAEPETELILKRPDQELSHELTGNKS